MAGRQTTTFMLAGVPFIVLAGIISQVVSLVVKGPTHRFAITYIALMVALLAVNIVALVFHLRNKTTTGVTFAAWCSLVCVTAMVWLDTITNPSDGLPWVLLTLYLAVYAIGEAVGGKVSVLYSTACGVVFLAVGIAQNNMDDVLPMLGVLVLVTTWAWRSFDVGRQLEICQEAIRIITDAKRRRHQGSD